MKLDMGPDVVRSTDPIDLNELIGTHLFGKEVKSSVIVLNLERDRERLENTRVELRDKVSVSELFRVNGTNGQDKDCLETDLNYVLGFLRKFAPEIDPAPVTIDGFSEVSDPRVILQDGPLGCYCSHLRAMIHGYENFDDYTVVVEDDILITDTGAIMENLRRIPSDWDIIFLNAAPLHRTYEGTWYKFSDGFHSTHFYIIRNSSLPKLFRYCYPMSDQIDILISESVHELNVYNIPYSVYQDNLNTNTQNNLHALYASINYAVLREEVERIRRFCEFFANEILRTNEVRNRALATDMLYDIVFEKAIGEENPHPNRENYTLVDNAYEEYPEYEKLTYSISHFITCAKKGMEPEQVAKDLARAIIHTLQNFKLHGAADSLTGQRLHAFAFGSTAHIYVSEMRDFVLKCYNDKLRWVVEGHDDVQVIFDRELAAVRLVQLMEGFPKLLGVGTRYLRLSYCGESLYHSFRLPGDWRTQIQDIYDRLTQVGVYYPEFKLQNILVLNGRITLVDFGLVELNTDKTNVATCARAIRLLQQIEGRFQAEHNPERRRMLLSTFTRNLNRGWL